MSVTISNDKLALLVHVFPCAVLAFGCFLPHASVAAYSQAAAPCISALPLQARAVCGTVSIQVLCGAGLSYLAVLLGILKASSQPLCTGSIFFSVVLFVAHLCLAFNNGVQPTDPPPPLTVPSQGASVGLDSVLLKLKCKLQHSDEERFQRHFGDLCDAPVQLYHVAFQQRYRQTGYFFITRQSVCIYSRSFASTIRMRVAWDSLQSVRELPSWDPFVSWVELVFHKSLPTSAAADAKKIEKLNVRFYSKNALTKLAALHAYMVSGGKNGVTEITGDLEDEESEEDGDDLGTIIAPGLRLTTTLSDTTLNGLNSSNMNEIFDGLIGDDWGAETIMGRYFQTMEVWDLEIGAWSNEGKSKLREVKFVVAVPQKLGSPPQTRVTNMFRVARVGVSAVIESTSESHDVPFGSYFSVQEVVTIRPEGEGIVTSKATGVHFVRSTMVKSIIESETIKACSQKAALMPAAIEKLHHHGEGIEPKASMSVLEQSGQSVFMADAGIFSPITARLRAMSLAEGLELPALLDAVDGIASVYGLLGKTMAPVKADLRSNVAKVRRVMQKNPAMGTSLAPYLDKDQKDRGAKAETTEGAVTCSVLWISRSLSFLVGILERLHRDDRADLNVVVKETYKETLYKVQSLVSRRLIHSTLSVMSTTRVAFEAKLAPTPEAYSAQVGEFLDAVKAPMVGMENALLQKGVRVF